MPRFLCVSVTFLNPDPVFHGRGDRGEPEYPPSPLRLFQALVAASAATRDEVSLEKDGGAALRWLERRPPPLIVAPETHLGPPFRTAVPNNDLDAVARDWSKHRQPRKQPSELKTLKTIQSLRLTPVDGRATLFYLWPLSDFPSDCERQCRVLNTIASRVTHLGWGVDQVAARCHVIDQQESQRLPGNRWSPAAGAERQSPVHGTVDDLMNKHGAFLDRLGPDGFRPVPALSVFQLVAYRRADDPLQRPFAAFSVLKPDLDGPRPFDVARRTREVAGMLRHAVADLARRQGWTEDRINRFVHGKTDDGSGRGSGSDRFYYLPLPTINPKLNRVESIRRVVVATSPEHAEEIQWLRRALAGSELIGEAGNGREKIAQAVLTILPGSDWVLKQYVDRARDWATVTPVILPGHDDRKGNKADKLLRTALLQAGYGERLIDATEIDWQKVGFHAGVDLVHRYLPPENLGQRPMYHVRLRFPSPVAGPVVVGSGRFRGFGLFAILRP